MRNRHTKSILLEKVVVFVRGVFTLLEGVDGWLDEFFCLDYFSSFTNVLNVRNLHEIKRPDSRVNNK